MCRTSFRKHLIIHSRDKKWLHQVDGNQWPLLARSLMHLFKHLTCSFALCVDREERLHKRRERDKVRRETETPTLLTICSTWSLLNFQRANHISNAHLKSLDYKQRAHSHHALMKSENNYSHFHIANTHPHDNNHLPSIIYHVLCSKMKNE